MVKPGPLSGQILGGKYLLEGLLGEGGFGMVYVGQHLLLNRPQAIKLLLEHYFHQPKFHERFLREAQTVAGFDHPHIVHIDDFGLEEQASRVYLVMPLLTGGTLHDILKKQQRPLELEQVVSYGEQISSALDYAHQRGVVHLDLKPQNLLVHSDGRLLLADFGLAHLIEEESLEGGTSLQYGTPHYMAPEHINGHPKKQSDVYSFGVVLYQMLVGRRPFEGKGLEVMAKHLTETPPALRVWRPELPIELEEVLEKALAKEVTQRYRSAGELLVAFKDTLVRYQERQRKAEEERQRKAEEERLRKEKEEQVRLAEEEQRRKAEEERLCKEKEEQVRLAEEEQRRKAEAERLRKEGEQRQPLSGMPHQRKPTISQGKPSEVRKASRRLSPLRRNLFLLGGVVLAGILIFTLFMHITGGIPDPGHTPSTGHSTPTVAVLNAKTVSHLVKKWTFHTGSTPSSPVVANGVVYVATDKSMYAIDALSGQQKWIFQAKDKILPPALSPLQVVDGTVYVVDVDDKSVYAIDALSGQQKWVFQANDRVLDLRVTDGVVYVLSVSFPDGYQSPPDDSLYAIDALSGHQKWSIIFRREVIQMPVVVNGIAYISGANGMYAIETQSGNQQWVSQTRNTFLVYHLDIENGVIYISCDDGKNICVIDTQSGQQEQVFSNKFGDALLVRNGVIYAYGDSKISAIGAKSGQQKWVLDLGGDSVWLESQVVDGTIYAYSKGNSYHNVYAINVQSGQKKWVFHLGDSGTAWSPFVVVNGVVYIGTDKGMYAINALSGQQEWTFTGRNVTSPAVVNNVVYVGSGDGNVCAFGLPTMTS
jgi:serine/threonine protein kinase/outer membrane protein assembly factor BamB